MEIRGPNLGSFQPQHIQVVRREVAESVKPNVFKDLDESVALALAMTDVVNLSPEAKEYIKALRKRQQAGLKGDPGVDKKADELIYNLKNLRDQVYGNQEEEGESHRRRSRGLAHLPPSFTFQLSGPAQDAQARAFRTTAAGEMIEKMIVFSPGREVTNLVKKDLEVLGEKMIETVKKFGVHIIIMEKNQTLGEIKVAGMFLIGAGEKTFDGRDWNRVRGLYDSSRKIMVVGEETVGRRAHSAPRHEFAHAFDHTFSENHHRKMPLSVQLWNMFADRRKALVTQYAGTNPAEYFAECVEGYFQTNLREAMMENDPQMYEYLDALFAA